jgi:hypothetical protein
MTSRGGNDGGSERRESGDAGLGGRDAGSTKPDAAVATDAAPDGAREAGTNQPPRWMGNPPECPSTKPTDDSPCSPEGTMCGYWWTDATSGNELYEFLGCWAVSSTTIQWTQWGGIQGEGIAVPCPEVQPENGSACVIGQSCVYPSPTHCECNGSTRQWTCQPTNIITPDAPTSLDQTKLVKDLTDTDRETFCTWFARGNSPSDFPLPPDQPPNADGTAVAGCATGNQPICAGTMAFQLPVNLCKMNLAISTCEAPLSDLVDCAHTMFQECWPAPHGCARYFGTPGCSGTLGKEGIDGGANSDCVLQVQ